MAITNQIVPSGQQPYANQMNFGQLTGRVNNYNLSCSPPTVQNIINNVVRRVYDRRGGRWYGLMTKGQFISPGFYSTGSTNMTLGSDIVVGTGTNWNPTLVGQQFRQGFTSPIYTIKSFIDATHLQLELPWGNPSQTNSAYFICQFYYFAPNVRYLYSVKNLQLMFRLLTGVPQSLIENWDPSRLQMLYPRLMASMPPTANGDAQWEMWPVPNTQQAFPWLGYTIPANLVNDSDNLPAFIRADIIELGATAEVLLHNPKKNPGYTESLALEMSKRFTGMFESELLHAADVDEGLFRNDVLAREETFPMVNLDWSTGDFIGGGAFYTAMAPVSADYF